MRLLPQYRVAALPAISLYDGAFQDSTRTRDLFADEVTAFDQQFCGVESPGYT